MGGVQGTLAPVSKDELWDLLQRPPPGFVLVDVRTRPEIEADGGVIPGARVIPLTNLHAALCVVGPAEFQRTYRFPRPQPDDPILFYCQDGSRAKKACKLAVRAGYVQVGMYPGGWREWAQKDKGLVAEAKDVDRIVLKGVSVR
eukprot:PhM_4_TR17285/c0_g1_i2/m.9516